MTNVENKTSIDSENKEGDSSDYPLKRTKFPATILDDPIIKNDGTSLRTRFEAERCLNQSDSLLKGTNNCKLVPRGWNIKEGEINENIVTFQYNHQKVESQTISTVETLKKF